MELVLSTYSIMVLEQWIVELKGIKFPASLGFGKLYGILLKYMCSSSTYKAMDRMCP